MASRPKSALQRWLYQYPDHAEHAELIRQLAEAHVDADEDGLVKRMLKALAPLAPDSATLATVLSIAHDNQDSASRVESIQQPQDVTKLIEQFQQVVRFDQRFLSDSAQRAEGLRRLILALIADVRVVLIVLAWQLARMQLARESELRVLLGSLYISLDGRFGNVFCFWVL